MTYLGRFIGLAHVTQGIDCAAHILQSQRREKRCAGWHFDPRYFILVRTAATLQTTLRNQSLEDKEVSMKKKLIFSIVMVGLTALAAFELIAPRAGADPDKTFTIDVALDGATYVQNNVDPNEKLPAFSPGDTLVVHGTIYPGGTLKPGIQDNDPNAPGGIGKLICRGVFLVSSQDVGAPFTTDVSEIYLLPDNTRSLVADGLGPNTDVTAQRAVLGGTGSFRDAVGELHEKNIGSNATGFCNLRMTFKLKSAVGPPLVMK